MNSRRVGLVLEFEARHQHTELFGGVGEFLGLRTHVPDMGAHLRCAGWGQGLRWARPYRAVRGMPSLSTGACASNVSAALESTKGATMLALVRLANVSGSVPSCASELVRRLRALDRSHAHDRLDLAMLS